MSEADILDGLAAALRARERLNEVITNMRGLAAELTDAALPELAERAETERVDAARLEAEGKADKAARDPDAESMAVHRIARRGKTTTRPYGAAPVPPLSRISHPIERRGGAVLTRSATAASGV